LAGFEPCFQGFMWRPQWRAARVRRLLTPFPRAPARAATRVAASGRVGFAVEAKQNSKKRVRQVTLSHARARACSRCHTRVHELR
jgi:hypothetical protein